MFHHSQVERHYSQIKNSCFSKININCHSALKCKQKKKKIKKLDVLQYIENYVIIMKYKQDLY